MTEIRWHGRGGQGAFTAAKILGAAAVDAGLEALSFPSFGPERRGAPVLSFTKIDDKKISDRSEIKKCDAIIVLDESLFSKTFLDDLKEGGKILVNSASDKKFNSKNIIAFDADAVASEILGRPVSNTAMLSFYVSLFFESITGRNLENVIGKYLAPKIAQKNAELIKKIYEEAPSFKDSVFNGTEGSL